MNLSLKNVSKRYGEFSALKGLNLELDSSRCLTLIGPSGGGKSTTLRLIAGLEKADSGQISLNGQLLANDERKLLEYRKSIGVVFQAYNLFPHLDALTNITLPLEKVHGFNKTAAQSRANELLDRLQLSEHSHKKPSELSGGQNQRVAIARALAHDPALLLFDEPTSALDPNMSAEVLDVIEELIQDGTDCIVVTHQMSFAKRVSDSIAFITNGEVAEYGSSSDIFDTPNTPELRNFLEQELKY
ncbi:amino acid ABC transporter ATP-binding protein [Pelagicoccus mobilis]|uniref:Amino acid ABC transporter ATP-binding protein n=1 Tax=Pelagicoccus mobilis TaxID=415221 RepID=A0A934RYT7_9BACT|nr:amino acid ABC transporter ATP-binding protein [Pelagicoccus mobilis]MBK1876339.1 amino acid ABC transporter ATP-binding protein [Pelagicoccus mobilis]